MPDTLNGRCEQIIKFLLRVGTASIEEILAVAGSSAPSIRRDLARLENRGLIRRTHGGATLWLSHFSTSLSATTVRFLRANRDSAVEKRRIGLAAAELVQPNETIGLSAGTTTTTHVGRASSSSREDPGHHKRDQHWHGTLQSARCSHLSDRRRHSLGMVFFAHRQRGSRVSRRCLHGQSLSERHRTGRRARRHHAGEADEAPVYRKMLKQSKQVIVVTDASKLGNVSPAFICPASEIHTIITNIGASAEILAPFERQGIRVIRA